MKCLLDIDDKKVRQAKTKSSESFRKDENRLRRRETTCSLRRSFQNLNKVTIAENDAELWYFGHV